MLRLLGSMDNKQWTVLVECREEELPFLGPLGFVNLWKYKKYEQYEVKKNMKVLIEENKEKFTPFAILIETKEEAAILRVIGNMPFTFAQTVWNGSYDGDIKDILARVIKNAGNLENVCRSFECVGEHLAKQGIKL